MLDFAVGRRRVNKVHVVIRSKPKWSDWTDQQTYDQSPGELPIRETHVTVTVQGFRTESTVVVSSFLTKQVVCRSGLADLYRQRRRGELQLRQTKFTMELDILSVPVPAMLPQKLQAGIPTYNLIRHSLIQSAFEAEKRPRNSTYRQQYRC